MDSQNNKGKGNNSEFAIILLLENIENGKVFLLEKNIQISNSKKLIKIAKDNSKNFSEEYGEDKYKDHFISLMSTQENMKTRTFEKKKKSFEGEEFVETFDVVNIGNNSEELDKSYTHNEMDRLLRDVTNNGSVILSNYDIPSSLFTDAGWKHTHGYSNPRYSVSSYTMENNFYGENIVFISMMDYLRQWYSNDYTNNTHVYETQLDLKHTISLIYCRDEDRLELGYENQGVDISNAQMVIGNLTNRNIFNNRYVSGTVTGNPETFKGLIALVPVSINNLPTVWDYLSKDLDQKIGSDKSYDQTYALQSARYGAEVIKSVSVDTDDDYLGYKGNSVVLRGKMRLEESCTFNTSYKYSCGIFN